PGLFAFLLLSSSAPHSYLTYAASSSKTPGLIVAARFTFFTYLPLAVEGFALTIASSNALALSVILSASKETLPTPTWITPVLSTRYSTLPALVSLTAVLTSNVTVPVLGLGIKPRGPSTFPKPPTRRIISGVETTASKSSQPSLILLT